ncbi:hypothetical protein ACS0TY_034335 [Phlomoides rotata]
MWMVDSNDHAKIPTDGRKLRPLIPRSIKINMTSSPYSNPSCSCNSRNPNILQWTHPICDYGVRREVPLVSTRWNPTPEQLQALEEMYRRGIRTPSAEQIQQIASKLRRFGKIEGKNVFYWFQNHKARERQKKRRQLELLAAHDHTLHTKQTPGLSRRYIEIEHHKKLPTPSKCSSTPSEDTASMQAAAVIAADDNGWTQLHHKILTAENEPSSQFVHLSSALSPSTILLPSLDDTKENRTTTLQLFPVHESGGSSTTREDENLRDVKTKFRPSEFIEFLPTKN